MSEENKPGEGWMWPPQSRKVHYFKNKRSLCGKFGAFFGEELDPDYGKDTPDDCAICRRKVHAMRETGELPLKEA